MKITRYELNEDFFATIDTEAKAYWLGFIAADGCVLSPRAGKSESGTFTMNLQERDAAHLEAFRKTIGYTGPLISFSSRSPSTTAASLQRRIDVHRTRFCRHLIRHGISPRKTTSLAPPPADSVPPALIRHFYRGFLDGDGWLSSSSTRQLSGVKRTWQVGIIGTQPMAQGFAAFVCFATGVHLNVYTRQHKTNGAAGQTMWIAKVCGVQAPQAVAHLLYHDSTVFLARKRAIADALLAATPKRDRQPAILANREKRRGETNVLNTFLTHAGETLSVQTWCQRLKLAKSTVLNRLERGDTPSAALRVPRAHRIANQRLLSHQGETLTAKAWARRLGINYTTVLNRLDQGEPVDRTLRVVGKRLTCWGESYTLSEWARRTGVKRTTIRERLKAGATPEEALRPVHKPA